MAIELGLEPVDGFHDPDFRLTGRVQLWRRHDDTWTGRFVYRDRSGYSVVHTVRGLSFS
ncbi:hypothetical protein VSX64_20915 [Aurantimonas sp. C2-6-R+9]|uniref:hypothetical protein n=1 Tax=unclassified Aurantimonas TaxID=2638230 RepID=UPI002E19525E|nr:MULTISPECIES: hypothetical protein [unclassified Aurantimonas]MEC5293706.1 hypothetical protein [Aurantimonas sp. C2-3-R2]MEC5383276.1 hypothetical protein [Aurantimonas sp. C2-6-R+9]MEC5414242.1 hypothetical protein [Aurantimonas sp. C2-4-R8]